MPTPETVERILDRARWAPSGDNTQPWRFEVCPDGTLFVHGFDTRREVVYDLEGHASQIAVGALLEYISISSTTEGFDAIISRQIHPGSEENEERPIFHVRFKPQTSANPDPLSSQLLRRSVNRRPFGTAPLTKEEKESLERELPTGFSLLWLETLACKKAMADLNQRSGKLRLTIPEAYEVHRRIIEWKSQTSVDRVPDHALGLSPFILPLMQWIMGSWSRVVFFNRFLGGTLIPRLELDILPALFCSAHFALLAKTPLRTLDDYVSGGRALARFWLACSRLDLQFQPEMTPLIFSSYSKKGLVFSNSPESMTCAEEIRIRLENLLNGYSARTVFLGRVGRGSFPDARSLRRSVSFLRISSDTR